MTIPALYLPTTYLAPEQAGQFLLFFEELVIYQPAENLPLQDNPLIEQKLLRSYPPAPFGKELDRFTRLLKDMQAHAGEYYQAYLADMGRREEKIAEADWRQMARQLKELEPKREPGEEELWRARLYLGLARVHAANEQEMARGLAAATSKEAALFKELQGEEEETAAGLELSELDSSVTAPAPERSGHLLEAWGLLYLADANPNRPWLLTTAQEEVAILLLEQYERATGRDPEKIISLRLPPLAPSGSYFEQRQALRTAAQEMLSRIGGGLQEAAFAGKETAFPSPGQEVESFPELEKRDHDSSMELTFYRLPGMSFPQLFSLFCRHGTEAAGPSSPHGILAVLTLR